METSAQRTPTEPQVTTEFDRRAAVAWIRAADAGLIDAEELAYLLMRMAEQPTRGGRGSRG